jgi:hypothetical protein
MWRVAVRAASMRAVPVLEATATSMLLSTTVARTCAERGVFVLGQSIGAADWLGSTFTLE